MKVNFTIEKPGDMMVTMEITMKLSEWLELQQKMNPCYETSRLSQAITSVLDRAKQSFYATGEDALK